MSIKQYFTETLYSVNNTYFKQETVKNMNKKHIKPKNNLRKMDDHKAPKPQDYLPSDKTIIEKPKRPTGKLMKESQEKNEKPIAPPVRTIQEGIDPDNQKKVFCEDCKREHLFVTWTDFHDEENCNYIVGYKETPKYKHPVYAQYNRYNLHNNCPHYKEKWFKKILRLFK
jgi:hypothetical protein